MENLGIEPATPGLQDIGLSPTPRRLLTTYGEAGNRTCDPWFTRHRFIPYTTAASHQNKFFVAFHWVETSTGPGGFMICVFII